MQDMVYSDSPEDGPASGAAYWAGTIVKWGGAALSLGLVVLLIVWAVRLGTRDAGEVPVIKAMGGAVRVAPSDPGGRTEGNQGLEVNEVLAGNEAGTPEQAELAPAPVLLSEEDGPGPVTVDPAPAETPESIVTIDPADLLRAEPEVETETLVVDGDVEVELPVDPGTDLQDLINQAVNEVAGEADVPAPRPQPRPADLEVAALAAAVNATPVEPVADPAPILPTVAAPAIPDVPVKTMPVGTRTVQLGAFDSTRDARNEWIKLTRNHGDLLNTRETYIQQAQSNGRTFYRLRVLGFETPGEQNSLCEALDARQVPCIAVTVR